MQSPSASPALDSQVHIPTSEVSQDITDVLSLSFTTPLSLLGVNSKDIREYEHDRKRTKKAEDYKARKYVAWRPEPKRFTVCGMGKDSMKPVSSEDYIVPTESELPRRNQVATSAPAPRSFSYSSYVGVQPEVKLADLVTSKKPRKGKHGDFEIIPHIRSVIVLDDFAEQQLVSIDEPWEYIHGTEDADSSSSDSDTNTAAKAPVSYAAVLSSLN